MSRCPCCGAEPLSFGKKLTHPPLKEFKCSSCGCRLKFNLLIYLIINLFFTLILTFILIFALFVVQSIAKFFAINSLVFNIILGAIVAGVLIILSTYILFKFIPIKRA